MTTFSREPAKLLVVFSHGKESGPQGAKIQVLAGIAREEGADTLAVDYREFPAGTVHDHDLPGEADRRVAQLLATALPPHQRLLLVGSSMGGYVSAVAARTLPAAGVFLLAPALTMPGYGPVPPTPLATHVAIVHGWRDEVIPWEQSARWAAQARCTLHLLEGDHRLDTAMPAIAPLFRQFVRTVRA